VGLLNWANVPVAQAQPLLPATLSTPSPVEVSPAIADLVATLEDEVEELPEERIRWSTYWKLCWSPYPNAVAYELQTVTSEGISPKLKHQSDRCYRLQAAAGENAKASGFVNRDLTLGTHAVQLGYRVRAVLYDNRVTEWSPVMPVGETTRPESQSAA
jgi:hypothetical protein